MMDPNRPPNDNPAAPVPPPAPTHLGPPPSGPIIMPPIPKVPNPVSSNVALSAPPTPEEMAALSQGVGQVAHPQLGIRPSNLAAGGPASPYVGPGQPAMGGGGTVPVDNRVTNQTNSHHGSKKGLLIGLIVFLVLFLGAGGFSLAVAYEKIQLNNPSIEQPIRQFVLGLPFMPKTTRYLLESAVYAQSKVTKDSFDVSLAAKSNNYAAALGLSEIDADINGQVDTSDANNLKMTMKASITKEFDMEMRKTGSAIYVKVNKIPELLWTVTGIDSAKVLPLFDNWIAFDTSTLETEAKKTLDQQSPQQSLTKEYLKNSLDQLLDKNLLPNVTISNESMDGHPSYKLHLAADDKTVDNLIYKIEQQNAASQGQKTSDLHIDQVKPSQYLKNLVLDMWVDQKDYYVRKIATSFTINPNVQTDNITPTVLGISKVVDPSKVLGVDSSLYSLGQSTSSIAIVVKFDNFGQSFTVEVPSPAIKSEDFYKQILAVSGYGQESSPSAALQSARDNRRISDVQEIQKGLEQYYLDKNKYVSNIYTDSSFAPDYVIKTPMDDQAGKAVPYSYYRNDPLHPGSCAKDQYVLCSKLDSCTADTCTRSTLPKNGCALPDDGTHPSTGSYYYCVGSLSS